MVSYTRARRKTEPKTAGKGPRVIVVFGPPSSGVSTMVQVLSRASEAPTSVVPYLGRQSLRAVEEALQTSEVVFLDVDGGLFTPTDVQAIVDAGLLYNQHGAIVRIYADDEECL